ncbi:hypothetical protein ACHAQE_010676 [Botrytis cinerea]|uniref:Uncharacterized protein n=1 Tax=Botryotinia fuckeliana (strain BcDW1) TaxID=1290391 RepID=M7UIY8_BOTF1|nr:hypothetical protein BcDW1_4604 [Botrytis cinerea BcDW1]
MGLTLSITTKPEVAAGHIEKHQIDGGGGTSGDDAEIGAKDLVLEAGNGSRKVSESEEGKELHFERE